MEAKGRGGVYEKICDKKAELKSGGWLRGEGGSTFFSGGGQSESKRKAKESGRIMFNFETKEVEKEFKRMVDAGAEVIKEPYEMGGMWIATLADPDGNYFQLMSPWKEEKN